MGSETPDAEGREIDTSIVLATCDRAAALRLALESLMAEAAAAPFSVEIVVVDDGSCDETPAVLAEIAEWSAVPLRVLQGPRQGVAAARNLGCFAARGVWLASFDDDQIALPGWLRELRAMADKTGAACVGGELTLQLPGGLMVADFGPRARRVLGEHKPWNAPRVYDWGMLPATNNVLLRRAVFVRAGGFDTSFTEGAEDTDFFDRVRRSGHAVWYQPASRALHVMTPRRLEAGDLRWTSLRLGASDARLYCRRGRLEPLRWAAFRTGVAVVRDLPQLWVAKLRGQGREERDAECSLWYTSGLLRALPPIMLGRAEQSGFMRSLNFRSRNGERAGNRE